MALKRLGQYAVVWRDGKVVTITPEADPLSEDSERRDSRA
jgi:hypothetical protein